ncbi:MAG: thioredoxin family protein [Chitinivibrionales bacterium]|nr:thioredoxin family protein [Chitinivibrionales bacterium]
MVLSDKDQKQIAAYFEKELKNPVTINVYSQRKSALNFPIIAKCANCDTMEQVIQELAKLSRLISVTTIDYLGDDENAEQKETVERIPCIELIGTQDYGIRYYGLPLGYEFAAFIETMGDVSKGSTTLSKATKEKLKILENKVSIKVFVTLNCPLCPRAVHIAHQMAIQSDYISADMIEIQEFPHLTQKYNIYSVPKVVLNETYSFEGTLPDYMFADYVLKAAGQLPDKE